MQFLDALLKTVENNTAVTNIIEFLIFLISNLDESLFHRTVDVRKAILKNLVNDIENLGKSAEINEKIVTHIDRNIAVIGELFAETEVKGLFDLVPHLESIEGEFYPLKIMNHVTNTKVGTKEFPIVMGENMCLWRLQQQIAEILSEHPLELSIKKSSSGTVISRRFFGTIFTYLPIWKDETLIIERESKK